MFYNIFIVCLLIYSNLTDAFHCKDENNNDADWFVVYKVPKLKHFNKLVEDGVAYLYITSTTRQWTLSKQSVNVSNSIIGNTLSPFYSGADALHMFYNDQPPLGPSEDNKGHTKGVILGNSEGGLWLIHSVPHFPPVTPEYQFPSTGLVKGQSFLCISLDLQNLNEVGKQLQYNQPQIYSSHIPKLLETKLGEIVKVVSGIVVTKPPWYNKSVLGSADGSKFISFAKSKEFGKDLYEDWVAPALESDLFVETWLNGPGRLASDCSKMFKVYNVESVNVSNFAFKDSQDHSKWAVASNSSWICIGDINRMEHQKKRGGGTVCFSNENISEEYRESIVSIEKC